MLLLLVSSICSATTDPNQGLVAKLPTSPNTAVTNPSSPENNLNFLAPSGSEKPAIALIISGDNIVRQREYLQEYIRKQLAKKFPQSQYTLTDEDQLKQELLILGKEEATPNIRLLLDKKHLVNLGKKFKADYVIFLYYGLEGNYDGIWRPANEVAVTLESKVVNVKNNQYIFKQDILGRTSNLGPSAFSTALLRDVIRCTNQFCQQIQLATIVNL